MDIMPSEIWTDVFALACTDDGYTGRALSTVSRAVHLISKPLKYQSICVVGHNQLLKLSIVLESDLSSGGRKVKYLFVASLDEPKDFDAPNGRTEIRRRFHPNPNRDEALYRILRLVSSSLLTLHIHRTAISRQSALLEMDLPVLTELTLHGPFKPPQPTILRPRTSFPSLRRIYIHHFAYRPAKFLQVIVHAAPLLTHLRVPQCSFTPYDIQVALGMLQPAESASDVVYLPRSLEKLVIEVDPVTSSLDSWASNARAKQFLWKLQKISDSDDRVCLVDGRSRWISVEQAKEEWLEDVL
ncbi:hypothetical protein DFH07DRAFT_845457 [Mycena maculata]|uniref:Uncharacterized protein n=1 Tax=Mycena maculata TaxID=230809 RepID=A0AAD7MVA0_9AGAR|nr:hypothetical protein DFH07DRAFT_845457 [Mycena maculata]